jgi:hypothetical protein
MFLKNKNIDEKIALIYDVYFKKYCTVENTINKTRDIVSDLKYFKEHIQRTKKSKFVTYTVIPSQEKLIHNVIVKKIGEHMLYDITDEDLCSFYVSIYEILLGIFNKYFDETERTIKEYREFKPILDYYLFGVTDTDIATCFIGCSRGISNFLHNIQVIDNQ